MISRIKNNSAIRGVGWALRIGVPLGIILLLWRGFVYYDLKFSRYWENMLFCILPIELAGMVGGAIGGVIAGATKEEAKRDKRIRLLGSLCGALAALCVSWLTIEIFYVWSHM